MASWTIEVSGTCAQQTLSSLHSAIFLPVLADGHKLYVSHNGQTINTCGPALARANPFPAPESAKVRPTTGTYGQPLEVLYRTLTLQLSLGSRLQAATVANGCPEYGLISKTWDMQSAPPIYARRVSVHRTSDRGSVSSRKGRNTPRATEGSHGGPNQTGGSLPADAARTKAWPTPIVQDASHVPKKSRETWVHVGLHERVAMAFGQPLSGTTEQMAKRAGLNPEFVSWLMGFPPEWLNCAPSGMPSSRKSRRNS